MEIFSLRWWLRLINFVEVDAKKLYENIIVQFQEALDEILYPGDERRIFLEQQSQIIVAIYNAINESAKQNLLRYAKGPVLDAIGEEKDTPRLQPQKATCIVQFNLSQAQPNNIVVPKGTRVTPDGALFFETTSENVIKAGDLFVQVQTQATVAGNNHNGFVIGQIKALVDPIPFIGSVSNINISSGGTDVEQDDDGINIWSGYRERIRLANAKISTAGHELGYIYHAKSADSNIQDVVVTSPNPGEILLTVLMKNSELPSQDVLDKVLSACNTKTVRPQTDKVIAASPKIIKYTVDFTYYISRDRETEELSIQNEVAKAVDIYRQWQDSKIGRHINPDYLRQVILNAGACKIDLVSPVFTEIENIEIAKVETINIIYGGMK